VGVANGVFSPSVEEVAEARAVLDALAAAGSAGQPSIMRNGQVYLVAHPPELAGEVDR